MSQDTTQLTPGLADTASAVQALLGSSRALSDSRQREAEAFIKENGASAKQHTPVTTDPRVKKGS